jgi:hypothetical protein
LDDTHQRRLTMLVSTAQQGSEPMHYSGQPNALLALRALLRKRCQTTAPFASPATPPVPAPVNARLAAKVHMPRLANQPHASHAKQGEWRRRLPSHIAPPAHPESRRAWRARAHAPPASRASTAARMRQLSAPLAAPAHIRRWRKAAWLAPSVSRASIRDLQGKHRAWIATAARSASSRACSRAYFVVLESISHIKIHPYVATAQLENFSPPLLRRLAASARPESIATAALRRSARCAH